MSWFIGHPKPAAAREGLGWAIVGAENSVQIFLVGDRSLLTHSRHHNCHWSDWSPELYAGFRHYKVERGIWTGVLSTEQTSALIFICLLQVNTVQYEIKNEHCICTLNVVAMYTSIYCKKLVKILRFCLIVPNINISNIVILMKLLIFHFSHWVWSSVYILLQSIFRSQSLHEL